MLFLKTFLTPLSENEEKKYLMKLEEGDLEAKNILIERNMRLVAHVAKKYQNGEEDMEDLISIGCIGLIKAVLTFRRDHGNKLGTYAARCIENELLMYFRSKKKTAKDVSLYEPVGTDKEGNQIQLMDLVEGEEQDVVADMEKQRLIKQMHEIMPRVLEAREKEIIKLRYGIGGKDSLTQRETAAKMGISRSYVSRIEKRALEKLKENLE